MFLNKIKCLKDKYKKYKIHLRVRLMWKLQGNIDRMKALLKV